MRLNCASGLASRLGCPPTLLRAMSLLCSCSLIRCPLCPTLCWFWRGFLVLVPGRWTACWTSNPKAQVLLLEGYAIAWGWGSCVQGAGLAGRFSTTSSSRRQCDGGGGSGLFLIVTSIYKLCQLSALSASILRLPEQTKTGATRGRGCQSRRKLMPPKAAKDGLARGGTCKILPQ